MIFLHFFEASAGIVFGTLCGVAGFLLAIMKAEEWYLKYDDRKWERWWQER